MGRHLFLSLDRFEFGNETGGELSVDRLGFRNGARARQLELAWGGAGGEKKWYRAWWERTGREDRRMQGE